MLQTAAGVRLTAAVLIRAVRAVWLVITLVTSWDAGAIAQAFKLLGGTPVARTLSGCSYDKMEISLVNSSPLAGKRNMRINLFFQGRPFRTQKRNGDLRQSVSSELSSQSLSPSQRHSLRAQRPFLHLNSLGSQGDGVPAKRQGINRAHAVV